MSDAASIRDQIAAGPSETDRAFAKAIRKRRTGPDEPEKVELPEVNVTPREGESPEMAALRAQVEALRNIVMSQKAPTSARRLGEVADAELAAEGAAAELKMVIDEATPRAKMDRDNELIFAPEDAKKIAELRANLRNLNKDVDIARALAGEIPRNHPGLKHLPPDHPVFRMGQR